MILIINNIFSYYLLLIIKKAYVNHIFYRYYDLYINYNTQYLSFVIYINNIRIKIYYISY